MVRLALTSPLLPLLATGFLLGWSVAWPPGPINAEIARRCLAGGFWAGFSLLLGACSGDALWAVLVSLGVGLLFTRRVARRVHGRRQRRAAAGAELRLSARRLARAAARRGGAGGAVAFRLAARELPSRRRDGADEPVERRLLARRDRPAGNGGLCDAGAADHGGGGDRRRADLGRVVVRLGRPAAPARRFRRGGPLVDVRRRSRNRRADGLFRVCRGGCGSPAADRRANKSPARLALPRARVPSMARAAPFENRNDMAEPLRAHAAAPRLAGGRILIVEARYYDAVGDMLFEGRSRRDRDGRRDVRRRRRDRRAGDSRRHRDRARSGERGRAPLRRRGRARLRHSRRDLSFRDRRRRIGARADGHGGRAQARARQRHPHRRHARPGRGARRSRARRQGRRRGARGAELGRAQAGRRAR